MINPKELYEKRKKYYLQVLKRQSLAGDRLGNLRVLVFILGLALTAGYYYKTADFFVSAGIIVATLSVFAYLVHRYNKIQRNIKYSTCLREINDSSIKRVEGEWKSFRDVGDDFKDENHNYSGDLDIFGQGSLFQWINTAKTFTGRRILAQKLSQLPCSVTEISRSQAAISELAANLAWRQRFLAEASVIDGQASDPERLIKWATTRTHGFQNKFVRVFFRLLPLLTITLCLGYLTPIKLAYYWPLTALAIQALMLLFRGKDRSKMLDTVYQYEQWIRVYYQMLKRLETKQFKSEVLSGLQNSLQSREGMSAFQQIDRLAKLVDAIANRQNSLFTLVNIITLWDYQCLIAMEDWKLKSGRYLENWLLTIGEVEALASLAVIRHDHPDWATPRIVEGVQILSAKNIGHPLLTKGRVNNDVKIKDPAGVLLITGSNMSGKSTLLRTAGINLVLAYAGAPACAKELNCSVMRIYTCMRVGDNLEKSISSFYAELLRTKTIVQASKEGGPIFFLLDEIFKGTNSIDRHLGAKVVIKQLSKQGALGMVSTHDLDLGELEKESGGRIKNFNFREYYRDDQIIFDYKLRPGLSTTRNALFLIKMAGIEVDEHSEVD